ncbi:alkaline phosphatase D family protein [Rhizorhabdus dicambivorans]|uniref:Alkaline phosphatase n=1 Tax=Rhizorhabdus dicambivorans TaxID=1850238 RepID=A0A2A4G1K1_9SPHN|nr:alkaline phosphatase D family protein [Rhizorhabdus dicambivorans]ATE65088.1 alkaline phosphatase [Rhizorhabdus dicambivorans]PCE44361.1 alkaline phosphatase [Rhizorhabdus dicambivorans]
MLSRRQLLTGAGAGLLAAPAILRGQQLLMGFPFRLGIAAGDPSHDGFVIWTRLCPDPFDEHGGMPFGPVEVDWFVYEDEGMRRLAQKGKATAWPELGHSIHVELTGLQPDRPYWYRFILGRDKTPLGRARTLPAPGARLDRIRFGVAGCQHYEHGLFTAYRHLAQEDVAFVWHYGDYIYEDRARQVNYERDGSAKDNVRDHVGADCLTIGDYRRRYAQYKMDQDLQAAHRAAAWFTTFDDHEVVDNWTSTVSPYQRDPALFAIRRAAAMQAYYEHMPLRRAQMPDGSAMQLYRRIRLGDLLTAHFLDTRQYRSPLPCQGGFDPVCPGIDAPATTVLGAAQEQWLGKGLRDSGSRWDLIAQQVMLMSLERRTDDGDARIRNVDSWAGYEVARQRMLDSLAGRGNAVVMTGDEHQNFAAELRRARKDEVVAVELVTTSISSGGDGWVRPETQAQVRANNPDLKYSSDRRGYAICDVGRDQWQTLFRGVDQVSRPGGAISTLATATIERGRPALNLS